MAILQQEIFSPVLAIIPFDSVNDTLYGWLLMHNQVTRREQIAWQLSYGLE